MWRGVDRRILLTVGPRRQARVCQRRKAAVLGAVGHVRRTPPGSARGAWLPRGHSGTWESHLSPCDRAGRGDRLRKSPGVTGGFHRGTSPSGTPRTPEAGQVWGKERPGKAPERDRVAVVAAQSTGEGGDVRPTRPTGGKAPSGSASAGGRPGRACERIHPDHGRPGECGARETLHGQQPLCLRNRMREWRTYGSVGGPDG